MGRKARKSEKFAITFTESALEDLEHLKKGDQVKTADAIDEQLSREPLVETRNRKPLRSNLLSSWELRVGDVRVFYDVDEACSNVIIRAIGWKEHNKLFIRGKFYKL